MRETYLPNRLEWLDEKQGYYGFRGGVAVQIGEKRVYEFLNSVDSFHFCSRFGYTATIRRETVQRGSNYWRAYKKVDGKLHKKYIGKTASITIEALEKVARQFASGSKGEQKRAQERREAKRTKPDFQARFDAQGEQAERPRKRTREEALREQREKKAREEQERLAHEQQEKERKRQEREREWETYRQNVRDNLREWQEEQARKRAEQEEARKRAEEARREQAQREYERRQRTYSYQDFSFTPPGKQYATYQFPTLENDAIAFTALELDHMPTLAELDKHRRKLAMKFHPDKFASLGKEEYDKANKRMSEINSAYDYLVNVRNIGKGGYAYAA